MTDSTPSVLKVHSGLKRYPLMKKDSLQAWDAADELLLSHLSEKSELKASLGGRVLIVGDSFGALTRALNGLDTTSYQDSFVSTKGLGINHPKPAGTINQLGALDGKYDLVLIRIPKNLSYFEDILLHVRPCLHENSQVVCAVMIKHLAKGCFDLLEKNIGPTSTSLAQKKARLVFAKVTASEKNAANPYPLEVEIEGFERPFTNHSNLFSREKLDVGTRFLLAHYPKGDFKTVLDLGCGNGVLGIAAKRKHSKAKIIFTDDSQMAIQSAEANFLKFFPNDPGSAEYHWTNAYEAGTPSSVDLILCNPPFHQGTTLGDFTARQMFNDALRVLKPGGTLRVVGNSHLQYQVILRGIFGDSRVIATNSKFMIVEATKPRELESRLGA